MPPTHSVEGKRELSNSGLGWAAWKPTREEISLHSPVQMTNEPISNISLFKVILGTTMVYLWLQAL